VFKYPIIPKKVNEISKYFTKNNQTNEKKDQRKSYTQVLTPLNNTRKVLKKTFPNLQAKKLKTFKKLLIVKVNLN